MKVKFLTTGFWMAVFIAHAQSGVSTQGGTFKTPTASVQWTIGQVASSTLKSSRTTLTQGFNQPQLAAGRITSINPGERIKLDVFPNPVAEQLTISMSEGHPEVLFRVLTVDGKEILSGAFRTPQYNIDFSKYSGGAYALILDDKNQHLKTFTIIKK
jgi:hypothetical protein